MKKTAKTKWQEVNPDIRFRKVEIPEEEDDFFEFEIFRKPSFLGFMRDKRWEMSIITPDYNQGLSFSEYLLKR